jgi:two-component sensor histidine kinase
VKNNLQIIHSLLDMQATRLADHVAREALRDSQNRVQSMALIHQTLYQSKDFAEVDFRKFLDTLVHHLQVSYHREDVQIEVEGDPMRLVIGRAIPCGLIVNELVTNAIKHGFPDGRGGTVRIRVRRLPADEIELSVVDDGVGLPPDLDITQVDSLGMQLVLLLSEQLHGELHVGRDPTCFSLAFPVHPESEPVTA